MLTLTNTVLRLGTESFSIPSLHDVAVELVVGVVVAVEDESEEEEEDEDVRVVLDDETSVLLLSTISPWLTVRIDKKKVKEKLKRFI